MSAADQLRAQLDELLARTELEHHRAGWDNTPPTLYWVGRNPISGDLQAEGARVGMIAAPWRELQAMANALEQDGPEARALFDYMNRELPNVAHMFVFELWARQETGSREEAEQRLQGKNFADIPGSVEGRMGIAVMGQHQTVRFRVRGQEPTWRRDDAWEWTGRIHDSLRRMQAVVRSKASTS